jgi:hypothetical protein
MNKYYVKMKIDFCGYIEAESESEAESKAWTAWGDSSDAEIHYDGVYSIDVDDMGAICEGCEEGEDECSCEPDEEDEEESE